MSLRVRPCFATPAAGGCWRPATSCASRRAIAVCTRSRAGGFVLFSAAESAGPFVSVYPDSDKVSAFPGIEVDRLNALQPGACRFGRLLARRGRRSRPVVSGDA